MHSNEINSSRTDLNRSHSIRVDSGQSSPAQNSPAVSGLADGSSAPFPAIVPAAENGAAIPPHSPDIFVTVTTEAQLDAAIKAANAATSGAFVIDLAGTITENADPTHIALHSGVSLTIDGGAGAGGVSTLDGGGAHRGLFVYSGAVEIENLVIQNATANGGSGLNGIGSGGGGGGGAGLGGGLFVAAGGVVSLSNVGFQGDSAVGGTGGPGGGPSSGTSGGKGGKGVVGTFGGGGHGGGSNGDGGAGHWGGGGGGSGPGAPVGPGGFGAGNGGKGQQIGGGSNGDGGGGGGGLGAGGDIFVQQGGSLTIVSGSLSGGTATGGRGGGTHFGGSAPNGGGFGGGMFLQGNESITLSPAAATTEIIAGVIADQSGSGGAGKTAGLGSLVISGAGTVDLTAANTFKGGVTIDNGVLELGNAQAGGGGVITFATGSGEVVYAAGSSLANTIGGFGGADQIDFSGIAYASGDHAVDSGGTVTVETAGGASLATFKVAGTYQSTNFVVGADTGGNVLITYTAAAAATPPGDSRGATTTSLPRPGLFADSLASWAPSAGGAAIHMLTITGNHALGGQATLSSPGWRSLTQS